MDQGTIQGDSEIEFYIYFKERLTRFIDGVKRGTKISPKFVS